MRTDIDFKKADTVTRYPGNHIYLPPLQSRYNQPCSKYILYTVSVFSWHLVAVYFRYHVRSLFY